MIIKIVSLDPSGNYSKNEKGNTGVNYLEVDLESKRIVKNLIKTIKAKDFNSKKEYYAEILKYVNIKSDFLVVENYKPITGVGTTETSELIGLIEYNRVDLVKQLPTQIKQVRLEDKRLVKVGLLEWKNGRFYCKDKKTDDHGRDAFRHSLQFLWSNFGITILELVRK